MPNWVRNKIETDNETLSKIKAECTREDENGNIVFDFNSVIPMPEGLKEVVAGGYTEDGLTIVLAEMAKEDVARFKYVSAVFRTLFYRNETAKFMFSGAFRKLNEADEMASTLRKMGKYDEAVAIGRKAIENVFSAGNVCWYDWAIEYWGTKWNVSSTEWEDGCIGFDTAWNEPANLIAKLSERYPNAEFVHSFADEDIGRNVGLVVYKGGKIIAKFEPASDSDATKFAEKLWN